MLRAETIVLPLLLAVFAAFPVAGVLTALMPDPGKAAMAQFMQTWAVVMLPATAVAIAAAPAINRFLSRRLRG